jgi:hypothetical protein
VLEFPLGELLHQRSELAVATSELAKLQSTNGALARDIGSLREPSGIAALAHGQYGLVGRGQRAYEVLAPASTVGGPVPALAPHAISSVDVVVPSAASLAPASARSATGSADGTSDTGSLWSRVVDRLAFWRWAF